MCVEALSKALRAKTPCSPLFYLRLGRPNSLMRLPGHQKWARVDFRASNGPRAEKNHRLTSPNAKERRLRTCVALSPQQSARIRAGWSG
eukprot:IDg3523t1